MEPAKGVQVVVRAHCRALEDSWPRGMCARGVELRSAASKVEGVRDRFVGQE